MIKKILSTLTFFFTIGLATSFGQINTSITNLFRYGDGTQLLGDSEIPFVYRENLTDILFRLPKNINVGFRLLYDAPPEVGLEFKGISRKFIEYTNQDLYLRAGDYSELYGLGLVINLFENRGLAYDTWAEAVALSAEEPAELGQFAVELIDRQVVHLAQTLPRGLEHV